MLRNTSVYILSSQNMCVYVTMYLETYRASDRRDLQRARCQQARTYRESMLKQFASPTYQQLQAWDRAVYDACKGL